MAKRRREKRRGERGGIRGGRKKGMGRKGERGLTKEEEGKRDFSFTFVQTQVNTNGILSFGNYFFYCCPRPYLEINQPVIAPFWVDIDIRRGGSISYRLTTVVEDYLNLQEIIRAAFTNASNFEMRQLFVATYDQVPAFLGLSEVVRTTHVCIHYSPYTDCNTCTNRHLGKYYFL